MHGTILVLVGLLVHVGLLVLLGLLVLDFPPERVRQGKYRHASSTDARGAHTPLIVMTSCEGRGFRARCITGFFYIFAAPYRFYIYRPYARDVTKRYAHASAILSGKTPRRSPDLSIKGQFLYSFLVY